MQTQPEPLPTTALPLHTVADAARALGVKPNYFYERIRDGRITTVNLGSDLKSKLRIRDDTLQGFVQERTTHATGEAA